MIDPAKQKEADILITEFFEKYKGQPLSSIGRTGAAAISKLLSIIEDYKDELIQQDKTGGARSANTHHSSY